jgi:multisubunit Na+/H+ antiporter MnhF subunit
VNAWLAAAAALLICVVPCGLVAVRGTRMEALVALELVATLMTLTFVLLAQGYQRSSYYAVALVAVAANFVGNLVYLRFMDRELR